MNMRSGPAGQELTDVRKLSGRASRVLKAMANERRFLVLTYLAEGERSVSELEMLIGISQSALSQHLARLRQVKLVSTRRDAQNIYYSLQGPEALAVIDTMRDLYAAGMVPAGNAAAASA